MVAVVAMTVTMSSGLSENCVGATFRVAGICETSVASPCSSPDSTIFLVGEIIAGDTDRLEEVLGRYGPQIPTISIRSPGGYAG
jgi:hypothetical protein